MAHPCTKTIIKIMTSEDVANPLLAPLPIVDETSMSQEFHHQPRMKRSPYLSAMVSASKEREDLMAELSRPSPDVRRSGPDPSHFFDLKRRPAVAPNDASLPSLRSALRIRESDGRDLSVSFSPTTKQASHRGLPDDSSDGPSSPVVEKRMTKPRSLAVGFIPRAFDERRQFRSFDALRYRYENSMLEGVGRNLTFRDMLDEGDGREGDWNLQRRNQRWKEFRVETDDGRTMKDGTAERAPSLVSSGRTLGSHRAALSVDDLAVLRRAAARANAVEEIQPSPLALMMAAKSSEMTNWKRGGSSAPDDAMRGPPRRSRTAGAGLAYGGAGFRTVEIGGNARLSTFDLGAGGKNEGWD